MHRSLYLLLLLPSVHLIAQSAPDPEEHVIYVSGHSTAALTDWSELDRRPTGYPDLTLGQFINPHLLVGFSGRYGLNLADRLLSDGTFWVSPFVRYYPGRAIDQPWRPFIGLGLPAVFDRGIHPVVHPEVGVDLRFVDGLLLSPTLAYEHHFGGAAGEISIALSANALLNRHI